jgi:hypothetical protein
MAQWTVEELAYRRRQRSLIYSLTDPRDGRVRYIGSTCCALKDRLQAHMRNAQRGTSKTRKDKWVDDAADEAALIRDFLAAGHDLLNVRHGKEPVAVPRPEPMHDIAIKVPRATFRALRTRATARGMSITEYALNAILAAMQEDR